MKEINIPIVHQENKRLKEYSFVTGCKVKVLRVLIPCCNVHKVSFLYWEYFQKSWLQLSYNMDDLGKTSKSNFWRVILVIMLQNLWKLLNSVFEKRLWTPPKVLKQKFKIHRSVNEKWPPIRPILADDIKWKQNRKICFWFYPRGTKLPLLCNRTANLSWHRTLPFSSNWINLHLWQRKSVCCCMIITQL